MNTDREIACCFTGHREIPMGNTDSIREHLKHEIERLYTENGVTIFYAEGATGFDALASEAVIERRAVIFALSLSCLTKTRQSDGA